METVIELPSFIDSAKGVLSEEEIAQLIVHLSQNPKDGAVIPGGSGLRKLRWARQGMGKRGGARIIYYYVQADGEVFLLLAYPKSAKDDLTQAQLKRLAQAME